jgi:hypothetical protein
VNLTPLQLEAMRDIEAGKVFIPRDAGVRTDNWFTWDGPRRYLHSRTVDALLRKKLVFRDKHDEALDKAGLTAEGLAELARRRQHARVASPNTRVDPERIAQTPYAQRMRLATAEIYLALACSHMLSDLDDTDHGEEIAARYGLSRADLKILANRIGARLEKLAVTTGYDMAWVDLDPAFDAKPDPSAA